MSKVKSRSYSIIKSSLNLKRYIPEISPLPYCELDYVISKDGDVGEITLWHGKSYDHCEEKWSIRIETTKFKRFTFRIPGVEPTFLLLSGKLYMRDKEVR